jgi:hypothetical protein
MRPLFLLQKLRQLGDVRCDPSRLILAEQLGRVMLADVPTSHHTVLVSQGDCPIRIFFYSGVVGGKADARALSSGENLIYKSARAVQNLNRVR